MYYLLSLSEKFNETMKNSLEKEGYEIVYINRTISSAIGVYKKETHRWELSKLPFVQQVTRNPIGDWQWRGVRFYESF